MSVWTIRSRIVRPVHAGALFIMATIVVVNVVDSGRLGDLWLGDAVAVGASLSAALLIGGWARKSVRLGSFGLLAATAVLMLRAVFIALTVGWQELSIWMTVGLCIITAGSFLIEELEGPRWTSK